MRITALAVLILLIASPAIAGGRPTAFSPPADISGNLEVTNAQWIAIFFQGGQGLFDATFPEGQTALNHSYLAVEGSIEELGGQRQPVAKPDTSVTLPSIAQLEFDHRKPMGSLILEAESIRLKGSFSQAKLEGQPLRSHIASHVPRPVFEANPFWDWHVEWSGPNVIGLSEAGSTGSFSFEAEGLRAVHWFGSTFLCKGAPCPDGGGTRTLQNVGIGDYRISEYSYGSTSPGGGSLAGTAGEALLFFGGNDLDLVAVGSARLPMASISEPCESCAAIETQTVQAEGRIVLQNTSLQETGLIQTELGGTFVSSRLDEAAIAPEAILGPPVIAGAAATIWIIAVLKWLIAPFFTRLSKEQALEHPRRKQIFDYIQLNPGANFREIARNTGIAAGTVRHHLNVLARSDIVVEHAHGSTVRFFENSARYQANWADHVLLREPALGALYEWLRANPGAPQKAVLEGMEPQGWSRSTTQHRLARLVDGGLATIRLQGRLKIYTAVDRSAKPAAAAAPAGRPPLAPSPS